MNTPDMKNLRNHWYGWRTCGQDNKKDILNTRSFSDLTYKMRDKARYLFAKDIYEGREVDCEYRGSMMASSLIGIASPFWSDFDECFPHRFMDFHYAKLPTEHHEMAKKIVEVLNKMKGGAWAYALCMLNFPDYEAHPLREKIINALECEAEIYDKTINLMRTIIQKN